MLGGHSTLDPPLPIPNRTVKRSRADDSALPCAKVGHRQAPLTIKALYAHTHRGLCRFYLTQTTTPSASSLDCVDAVMPFARNKATMKQAVDHIAKVIFT